MPHAHRPALLAFAVLYALTPPLNAQDGYELTLLHSNDTHAHHEPQTGGDGGIARQAGVLEQIRREVPNTLLVDAGDRFTGTLYHRYYQGVDNARVMNALGYDAMALGNHEFDNGLDVLEKFIELAEFPVLAANLVIDGLPALAEKIAPSTVVTVGGESIGVIGLVTAETPTITANFPNKDQLTWRDDYAAVVNAEVERLQTQGVDKIILVAHLGLDVERELAARTRGVDVLVGGHSHTALSNVYQEAELPYPLEIKGADGQPVYVVQAGDRNRYLGRLDLRFDAAGNVTRARGDLILLSKYITPAAQVQALLDELAEPINGLQTTPVTTATGAPVESKALLSNHDCRDRECALGNLIADAIRAEAETKIAIMNGGGIRADIDQGPVTLGEVLTVLPFGNTVATLKLKGADLYAALENGVSRVGGASGSGRFPQVSGLRYGFDPGKEPGNRIISIEVGDGAGGYAALDPEAVYTVATNNFLRTGGDGYDVFKAKAIDPYDFGRPLEEALIDHMAVNSPLTVTAEGRIRARR